MTRIVQTTRRITERGADVIDPKTIPMGAVGRVEGEIVPGYSVWVNFGRGLGTVPISEEYLREMTIEELWKRFRG